MRQKFLCNMKKSILSLFLLSLFASTNNSSQVKTTKSTCTGINQIVQQILFDQIEFATSLQIIIGLQKDSGKDLESIVDALGLDVSLSFTFRTKMPTKGSRGNLQTGVDNLNDMAAIIDSVRQVVVDTISKLRIVQGRQFSSIDTLEEVHVKIDSILDLLGTATADLAFLTESFLDCTSELDDLTDCVDLWTSWIDVNETYTFICPFVAPF